MTTGGTGQGTSTTYDGVVYCGGGSGFSYANAEQHSGTVGQNAGSNYVGVIPGSGVTPTVAGCAGGWCVLNSALNDNESVVTSGAGANGIAIFKWTT